MKHALLFGTLVLSGFAAGLVRAEAPTPASNKVAPAAAAKAAPAATTTAKSPSSTLPATAGTPNHRHHPGAPAQSPGPGPMGRGHGKGPGMGMMKAGMMGEMGGMCPMIEAGTKMEVKNLANGVVVTLTNSDADAVARLQKAAEGMRLMREAHAR
ncbi:MAG TPA: hypothetical protein VGF45_01430 [Polyangia bacterium]